MYNIMPYSEHYIDHTHKESSILSKKTKHLIICLIFLSTLPLAASYATPVSWTISGPGMTSATPNSPNHWVLKYALNPAGFSTVTWNASSTATTDEHITLNWVYSGFHAYFDVKAFLTTTAGDIIINTSSAICCTPPSAGFNYMGSYTFTGLMTGDTFGFSFGGSNFDINNQLNGTLNLVEVSSIAEPSALFLLVMGLLGVGISRKISA